MFGKRKFRKHVLPKRSRRDLQEMGIDPEGVAYCLHCDEEIKVADVLGNPKGDWCPTEGCDGGGWGVDMDPEPWWRRKVIKPSS